MYFYLRRANLVSQGHLAFEQRLHLYAKYSKYKTNKYNYTNFIQYNNRPSRAQSSDFDSR